MKLDTHVHTSPGSRCSSMPKEDLFEAAAKHALEAVCLTNHGDLGDYDDFLAEAAGLGLILIPGCEISSPEGDFLIFSEDLDFMRSLAPAQELPERSARPRETAVVWAHPFAGNGGGLHVLEDYIKSIVSRIDGIEVFNGNWPDERASAFAGDVAVAYGLAELGGSDAHRSGDMMRCWTETGGEMNRVSDLIKAILERRTSAARL